MYVGGGSFTSMSKRVIYQVIEKNVTDNGSLSTFNFQFRTAFDFENPTGTDLNTVSRNGTRDMRRLDLVDLGTLRLHFDRFIEAWAKKFSEDDDDVR